MIDTKKMAKQLVDLRRPKKPVKETKGDMPIPAGEQEKYPYGTRISLEKDEIKKLGIKTKDRGIGQKVTIVAEAEIISLSERQTQGGDDRNSIEFQITKMKIF